ncbi:archaellin/type IV pilin N-terminal domain-containing protein [Nitrosopumilus ureiphilus]|uniref:Type IV pilin n=1 Tax=Nitrosopumilus ureiphilus TaxID=1470067 RepID=A0A7D5M6N9_9ARCH|nr:archaellin/type IV pilin N-terminal domain-containing protein [Nitrosopumilus ureiphilus]QLH07291.1 hypothetical protein C5F50_09545 [Nitrosopumilus ureiphilus]
MTNNEQKKFALKRRRAISPILAVIVLLGITVVAGGLVFSVFSTSATTASSADVIAIQNVQAIKGTGHADITATVKNAGGQPWTKIEMTVSKSELSEPILYESLHEVFQGCDGTPDASGNCAEGDAKERDNPMRAQWLGSLDKTGGTTGEADKGEGIAAGRKLVFEPKDSYRTIKILNGTSVGEAFGVKAPSATYTGDLTACTLTSSWSNGCTATLKELDSSVGGNIACKLTSDSVDGECKAYTHQDITGSPIGTGQSVYFYADVFTNEITGLNNQVVRVGDNLVANIFATNADGGETRVQTIIKVTGV